MTDITLKAEQRSAMEAIYNRQDVFVWLPTGYGKSVLSSPAILMGYKNGVVETQRHSLVLVVSPLVALKVGQVTSLRKRSVAWITVTSSGGSGKDLLATEFSLSTDPLLFCTPKAWVRFKWRYKR